MADRRKLGSKLTVNQLQDKINVLHRKLFTGNQSPEFSRIDMFPTALDRKGRNLDVECGYPTGAVSYYTFDKMFRREGIANRVISLYPDETWASNPELTESPDPNVSTKWEKKVQELLDNPQTNLWHYLHRVDVLSGIGQFGGLFFGFNDGLDESEPVPGIDSDTGYPSAKGPMKDLKLMYLRAFAEDALTVGEIDDDPLSPRCGLPLWYNLTVNGNLNQDVATFGFSSTTGAQTGFTYKVHWTRILHIADNRMSSEVYGLPRAELVLNRLLDIRKILGSSGEMFYKGAWPGHSIEAMPGVTDDLELDAESIRDQMELYYNNLKRYVAFVGATVKPLAPNIVDPAKHFEAQLQAIAAALGCPLRVFTGSEAAHLASTQDIQTWNKRLAKRQTNYVKPMMIDPLIERLTLAGILPKVDKYYVTWKDLNALSDKDIADMSLKQAQALLQYVSSGAEKVFPLLEFLTIILRIPDHVAQSIVKRVKSNPKLFTKELWKQAGNQLPGSGGKSAANKTNSGSSRNGTGKVKKKAKAK